MAVEDAGLDTFPKLLLHHAKQRGGRPAIREKSRGIWRTMTWGDLAGEVTALAGALSARGLQRGMHVALVGDNRPRLYAAMCAAQWLGAVAVPLYQDAGAEEMAVPIQRSSATHVFAENQEQVDKLLEILPKCPSVRCIVYDEDRGMRHYKHPQLASYADLVEEGRSLATSKREHLLAEALRGGGPDPASLFFTSGTTGPAKGVVLTHASLIDRARVSVAAESLNDRDIVMAYLPPGWVGQNLFGYAQSLVAGYCFCCPESSETMLSDMREMGPTYFLAPPRVLEALLTQVTLRVEDAGGISQALYRRAMALARRVGARILSGEPVGLGDRLGYWIYNLLIYGPLRDVLGMSRVRAAYAAGDAIEPELLLFFRSIGVNLKQLYGSTETGVFVAMQRDGEVRPDTVGPAAPGVELKISAQREILVRSAGLFKEYHHDRAATVQAHNAEGWFRTGDAGSLDQDGHLRVIDRMTNLGTLSDGSPYSPRLLENKLKFLPYIKEAVAFGDGRDRVCVLVDIDFAVVSKWADRRSISYTGHADLASLPEIYELIAEGVGEVNAGLAQDAGLAKTQIHRFLILHKELDADDGLLTRTGTLRRGVIAERFRPLVDAMYEGRASVHFGFDASADVRISDAKTFTPLAAQKVA